MITCPVQPKQKVSANSKRERKEEQARDIPDRRLFRRVVLPLPRKPVKTVTGT